MQPASRASWCLETKGGEPVMLQIDELLAHGWRARRAGLTQTVHAVPLGMEEGAAHWHLQAGAVDWLAQDVSYLPPEGASAAGQASELRAPFNGRVVQLQAQAGQQLQVRETAIVIESMKLEHSLGVRADCVVEEVLVAPPAGSRRGRYCCALHRSPRTWQGTQGRARHDGCGRPRNAL